MNEDFIHYLWKHKLYNAGSYATDSGEPLEIIHPGLPNTDAGPDFFNAKVKIGDTLWAGNIEIHLKASDWIKHNHNKDKAYDNVILHVVTENDMQVSTTKGRIIPAWQMPIPGSLFDRYRALNHSSNSIPCAGKVNNLNPLAFYSWLERMAVEKLQDKVQQIEQIYRSYNSDWDEVLYVMLTRNFGYGINSQPFEQLARLTPWRTVLKNRDDVLRLEALFLGQAGLLSPTKDDDAYTQKLRSEYLLLKTKYGLSAVEAHQWKFLRLRPSNFPSIRLAQLASLFHQKHISLQNLLSVQSAKELGNMLSVSTSDYWITHYRPGTASFPKSKNLGKQSCELLIINTLIPLTFAYGQLRDDAQLKDKAISWLEAIKPEKNSIIDSWNRMNMRSYNAMQTQALIHLTRKYCHHKRCLHCRIGHLLIASS